MILVSTGYGQFCAVARALDVLGERWSLLIVRELLLGSTTFGEIQRGLPRIPPATLAKRLRALDEHGVVERSTAGYHLTEAGRELMPVLTELARWASGPGRLPVGDEQLDTALLTWELQRRIDPDALPARRVTIEIEFLDRPPADRRFWLRLDRPRADLCTLDVGDEVDVWLAAETRPLVDWWLGSADWASVVKHPATRLDGPRQLVRALPGWFLGYALALQS